MTDRLYDNAQLLPLYLDAYLLTKSPLFLSTVHDIATYLSSPPIQSSTGGFHASEDADSAPTAYDDEHKEGAFYVWSADEFKSAIGDEKAAEICAKYWAVREDGNVSPRYDPQGELEGRNTLCVVSTPQELAKEFSLSEEEVVKTITKARSSLLAYRDERRPRPHLDDKIVVSWNGLAISGLARTASALSASDPKASSKYLSSAQNAAKFIRETLYEINTKALLRVYREGPGSVPGFADDYAFLIAGLVDLYEATFDDAYLTWATELQETQLRLFYDGTATLSKDGHSATTSGAGGFFSTAADAQDVLIRSKDAMDNAEPSTNGVSASNLFKLGSMLDNARFTALATATVKAFDVEMGQHPGLFTGLLGSVVMSRLGVRGFMISGEDVSAADEAVKALRTTVRPGSTVVRVGGSGTKSDWLRQRNGLLKELDGRKELVQLCEGRTCRIVEPGRIGEVLLGQGSD